jgi:hypothetical protein
MVVKMNQPCLRLVNVSHSQGHCDKIAQLERTYHQEETHGVIEFGGVIRGCAKRLFDLESTGGQDDSESEPETTVRGQSSGTESVTNSHFPRTRIVLAEVLIYFSSLWL